MPAHPLLEREDLPSPDHTPADSAYVGATFAPRHPAGEDTPSFDQHFKAASNSMTVLAAALVGRSDAPDVVQEAAIVALRRFDTFQPGTSFAAWMAAIVRNVARNHRRGQRRRTLRLRFWATLGDAPHADRDARASDLGVTDPRLLNAVEALDTVERACLLLKVVREHSYADIAAMLDIPEATARSHVFRARKALLAQLGEPTPSPGGQHA